MLIGIAAGLLILTCNKILGVSGILGGLFKRRPGDAGWRLGDKDELRRRTTAAHLIPIQI
jgi:hypothetical protein